MQNENSVKLQSVSSGTTLIQNCWPQIQVFK